MLTDDEIKVAGDAYAARRAETERELWFCVDDDLFAAAARLHEKRWLALAWFGDDSVWRMTDEGMSAVELARLVATPVMN